MNKNRISHFVFLACAACCVGAIAGIVFNTDLPLWLLPVFGLHMELVTANATAPGATGAAGAALSGDSLVVKNASGWARVIKLWGDYQVAGFMQLFTPSGHDTTRGFRSRVKLGTVENLLPPALGLSVQPQETMSITIAGSAVAGDVESLSMLMLYDELRGSNQRGISWPTLQKHGSKITTVDLTLTGAATGYTGSEAINVDSDLLMANRDYALLGGIIDTETATVFITGPDTGNVKIGFPADTLAPQSSIDFFCQIAREFNAPLIPVINSGNKASTLVGFVQDENNISPKVTLYLALLE